MGGSYIMGKDADLYAQNSTTYKCIDSSGNVQGNVLFAGSSSIPVASSVGVLYFKGAAISAESSEINASTYNLSQQILSSGSSATAIRGYGVTIFKGDTGCSLSMSPPPQANIMKTIIFTQGSSIARSINSTLTTGSTDGDRGFSFYSTAASNSSALTFTTGTTGPFAVQLFALSTAQWIVIPFGFTSCANNYTLATT